MKLSPKKIDWLADHFFILMLAAAVIGWAIPVLAFQLVVFVAQFL